MKKTIKKLALNHETLRTLSSTDLGPMHGGIYSPASTADAGECTAGRSACNSRGCVATLDDYTCKGCFLF